MRLFVESGFTLIKVSFNILILIAEIDREHIKANPLISSM